ncbi:hypothetical protein [Bacillus sp. FSL K6-3431]|uniref:hypothetical protein n=1 Tax=Bacillus sp. FSL K6-3431 TaxID=2921500 RepID=UPI0030FC8FDA
METVIIILLSAAILLFLVSFFQKDRVKIMEKEVEQLSMNVLQEQYMLKKRMKVLEEELLVDDDLLQSQANQGFNSPNEILKSHVLALYNQGLNIQQISNQSSLPVEKVQDIINRRI